MSLKLYLSGASTFGGASVPAQSFGKYPSNEEVQNDMLGNLFGDLSRYTVDSNRIEYRAIVLQNDSDSVSLSNIKAWIEYPVDGDSQNNSATEFELGLAELTTDSCGDIVFAKSITSPYSAPYGIAFAPREGFDNALDIPALDPELMVGLWIKRKIKAVTPLTDAQLLEITEGTLILPSREDIKIHFSWD